MTKEKFRKFVSEFVDEDAEDMGEGFDPLLPVYVQRLDEVIKHLLSVRPQKLKWDCLIEFTFHRFMSWRHLSLASTVVI